MTISRLVRLNGAGLLLPQLSPLYPISIAGPSSGVHKQGYEVVDTTGHTGHHFCEVTSDSATGLTFPWGPWHWMNTPLSAGTLLVDQTLVMPNNELVPVTWNGETTLEVVTDGVTVPPIIWSDTIDRTVTRAQKPAVRTFARASSGTAPVGVSWYSATDTLSWYQSGNHLSDNPSTPPSAPGPAYTNTYYAHPLGLFAYDVSDRNKSVVMWGDSNMANSYMFTYHERSIGKRWPYYRMASAGQALASASSANVRELMRGYEFAIIAMGTNNLSSSAALNIALLQTAVTNFRSAGVSKIMVCTLPPSTASSNGWVDVAGQVPQAEPNLSNLNDLIRAHAAGDDVVFDAISYVGVDASDHWTQNQARWSDRPSMNGDNVHYKDPGMANAAAGQTVALDRMIVNGETGFVLVNPALGT